MPRKTDTIEKGLSAQEKERLLYEYKPFILRTASVMLKRYVSESDDAWSIALIAFSEALDQYDPGKGNSEAYARLVIRRRLVDDLRRLRKFQPEIDMAPEAFSGSADPAPYGFSFWDLADCSPKAGKTRAACAAAIRYMLLNPGLVQKMQSTRRLPIYALAAGSRVSLKVLARHRRYIIAACEILTGDYPGLSRYLKAIGKGEDA